MARPHSVAPPGQAKRFAQDVLRIEARRNERRPNRTWSHCIDPDSLAASCCDKDRVKETIAPLVEA
jgi:hypothetical protein